MEITRTVWMVAEIWGACQVSISYWGWYCFFITAIWFTCHRLCYPTLLCFNGRIAQAIYSYMNYLDTLLLANYVLIWYIVSAQLAFSMVLVKLLYTLPMAIFILGIILRKMSNTKINDQANKIYNYMNTLLNKARNLYQDSQNSSHYCSLINSTVTMLIFLVCVW